MHLKSYCQLLCLALLLPLLSVVAFGQTTEERALKLNASAGTELSEQSAGQSVGRLYLKDGKWVFEGNVDESARLFLQSVNRVYAEPRSKGPACRFDDLLEALTVTESLYLPRVPEQAALIEDPYVGTTKLSDRLLYGDGVTITPMQLDWDRATPDELRQLANSREEIKAGIVLENTKIKAQTARRNAVAEHIRNLLAACGVKTAACAECQNHTVTYGGTDNGLTLPSSGVSSGLVVLPSSKVTSGLVVAGDSITWPPTIEGSVINSPRQPQPRRKSRNPR